MLRKIRIAAALFCFVGVTLLFLDFTGTLHAWLGWLAEIQFLPAVLAVNAGVVAALVVLTLLFGRVYCSVVCPLGVMQDLFARMGRRQKKNRYAYSPALTWLRYGVLALFVVLLVANMAALAALVAPYSAYGRIAQNLLAPLYAWGNNLLALAAERADSYAFYTTEVWMKGAAAFAVAVVTLVVVGTLAWRNGRTWCNTICPVGSVLGLLSKYSLFRPVIDPAKCTGCKLCARNCKAACIDVEHHAIDHNRCVVCLDCIDKCRQGAIVYERRRKSDPAACAEPGTRLRAGAEAGGRDGGIGPGGAGGAVPGGGGGGPGTRPGGSPGGGTADGSGADGGGRAGADRGGAGPGRPAGQPEV